MVQIVTEPASSVESSFDAKRKRQIKRYSKLRDERQSGFDPVWRDICDYIAPGFGRFFSEDLNEGGRQDYAILDNTPEHSAQSLAAMVMAYSTPRTQPWFQLTTVDPFLAERHAVKLWLSDTTKRMQRVFARSNTYSVLHQCYEELVAFGNSCAIVTPSIDTLIHLHPVPIGQYVWAQDYDQNVNTCFREFKLTVGQVVSEFGLQNCSQSVQNRFKNNDYDSQVTIVHAIEPRRQRDARYRDNKNMPWRSCYFELGSSRRQQDMSGNDEIADSYLRESGFEQFPVLAGRWRVFGGDTYARGPGLMALGDSKSLQHLQQRFGLCVDLQTDPPYTVPMELGNMHVDGLPGGRTPVPSGQKIESMNNSRLELQSLMESIRDTRSRIERTFFVDSLLRTLGDYPQKTAHEIVQRNQENLMFIGPAQQRMEVDIQKPLIKLTLGYMIDAGALLPPPPELMNAELNVEFVSVFAQAQRAANVGALDRYVNTIGALSAIRPDVTDKLNTDKLADIYAESYGVDPEAVNPNEAIEPMRKARAQQTLAAQQTQLVGAQAKTAKDLAQADTGGKNALTDILAGARGGR